MNKTTSDTSKTWYLCSLMYLLSLVTYTIAQCRGVSDATEKTLSGYPTWPFTADSERFYILKAIWLPADSMGYTLINEVIISDSIINKFQKIMTILNSITLGELFEKNNYTPFIYFCQYYC